jgi:hypothetical protein
MFKIENIQSSNLKMFRKATSQKKTNGKNQQTGPLHFPLMGRPSSNACLSAAQVVDAIGDK